VRIAPDTQRREIAECLFGSLCCYSPPPFQPPQRVGDLDVEQVRRVKGLLRREALGETLERTERQDVVNSRRSVENENLGLTLAADDAGRGPSDARSSALTNALRQLFDRRKLGELLDLCEEIIG
jgi:hypothetical protein